MKESILSLNKISRTYQVGPVTTEVLTDVNLDLSRGDMVSIMGPSGSGKTTLMNTIGLLDRPTSGSYHLNGNNTSKLKDNALAKLRNRQIGFVFQSFHLLAHLTAAENVALPLVYRGTRRSQRMKKAKDYLQLVGLEEHAKHQPDQLSGGQKQRVAIARAVIGEPVLLLADEPTGALDAKTASEVLELLKRLNREKLVTILMITHDIQVAYECPRQLRMKGGTLVELNTNKTASESLPTEPLVVDTAV
ncbi:MAG: ABC transporter ATP-binding protein [Gammaproteobacteria bacterium]|nr:ABC transporter ATP-binding protein [Gammaproteobacteria bacterium]MCY4218774.1 ABC transporter ATP-binding protein [Gammaproteobacteria bacterium]MCY4276143.1 ABC transporter ATP-binding protein [Gammaproteobacteria bacterium]